MIVAFEKTPVVDLKVDINKNGICIGDDLSLAPNSSGDFVLYFQPKQSLLTRMFINKRAKRLGHLEQDVADYLRMKLGAETHIRIRVVDAVPKHLSRDNKDRVFVSIWL